MEGSMMILITCAAINLYQMHRGEISPNSSFYLAVTVTVLLPLYTIGLTVYLCKHHAKLDSK